jgi:uncharacterized protein (TIGR02453 family)
MGPFASAGVQARCVGSPFRVLRSDMAKKTRASLARFEGFADRDGRFFHALARNQRREWFALHRAEYEQGWLAPMKALLTEVRERLEPLFRHEALADPKVFRIHRDVRFSKDKAPYKTHIGGYVAVDGAGQGPAAAAALYVHVGAQELFVAAGQYMMDPEQLGRFRAAVVDERRGREVAALVRTLTRAGFAPGAHATLQRVPRGFAPDHPRADLLRHKGLIVSFPAPPRQLLVSRRLVDWLVTHAKRTVPLVEWLAAVIA